MRGNGLPVVWPVGPFDPYTLAPRPERLGVKKCRNLPMFLLQETLARQGAHVRGISWSGLTSVTSLPLGFISQSNSSTGVDYGRLFDNETITVKTGNVTARVGQGNLVNFIGVQPNLALSAFQNGGSQTFLQFQRNCS